MFRVPTYGFAVLALAVALFVGGEDRAAATTFCVPTFGPACANTAGNVAEDDLEKAMNTSASDGSADTIVIAAGSLADDAGYEPSSGFKNPAVFEPNGSDPLTVLGAGRAATTLTSEGSGNIYMLLLGSRKVTMRDLTLEIPASFPDDSGAAVQMYAGDLLERVDVVSLNVGSDGVSAVGAGNVFRDGELRGGGLEGELSDGFDVSGATGALLVEDAIVRDVSWPLIGATEGTLTARRVSVDSRTYGAIATSGHVVLQNSVLTLDAGIGLYASAGAEDASLLADHVTVVNSGGTNPALEAKKFSGSAGDATLTATNSIFRGFVSGYKTETPIGPGIGVVSIKASYSNLSQTGSELGGSVDVATGNIDADPQLLADYSLPPTSPSIDAGSPFLGLNDDFLGAPRPSDGNGDGLAIRDQGAFEYQRPPTPGGGGGGGTADTTKPKVQGLKGPGKALAAGKAKFSFRANEAGSKFVCKLDRRKAAACKSPKSYSALKPGRHTFKVWAIDPAGNKSAKPAKRKFRVPAASPS